MLELDCDLVTASSAKYVYSRFNLFICPSKNKIGQRNVQWIGNVDTYFDSNILIQMYKYEYFSPA